MNEQIARILTILRNVQNDGTVELPEGVSNMLRNAENAGNFEVVALSGEQYENIIKMLSPEDAKLLSEFFKGPTSIHVNKFADLADPRYKLSHDYAKELADNDIALTRLLTKNMNELLSSRSDTRLMLLHQCDIRSLLEKESAVIDGVKKQMPNAIVVAGSLFTTLGFSNWLDVVRSGPDRLEWHGVSKDHFLVAEKICFLVAQTMLAAIKYNLGDEAAANSFDFIDSLMKPKPLSPLDADKQFIDGFDGPFFQRWSGEHQALFEKLKFVGLNTFEDVIFKSPNGLEQLEKLGLLTSSECEEFGKLSMQVVGDSIEAAQSLKKIFIKVETPEIEKERIEAEKRTPPLFINEPIVKIALGTNLVTAMEIAGVTDVYQMTGLRPFEPARELMESLPEPAQMEILGLTRAVNPCDCEECQKFYQVYFSARPDVKAEIDRHYRNKQ